MRVALLTTDSCGAGGGIAQYNRDLARALASMARVDRVEIVSRNGSAMLSPTDTKIRFDPTAPRGSAHWVVGAVKACARKPDLVICGHVNLLPVAGFLCRAFGLPLVLMTYGVEVWTPPPRLKARALGEVDAVWSISQITAQKMQAWSRLPESAFSILPNAIHLEDYGAGPLPGRFRDRHALHDKRVVLTLGRLASTERYKGFDEILQIMPALLKDRPEIVYVIAGGGDDRPRLEAKARDLGVADKVLFAGFVAEEDKADLFRSADVFAMPGKGEGFGFVFLEALACGTPSIGSAVDGSREALRSGLLGQLVDPAKPDEIRAAILSALDQPRRIPDGLAYFAWPDFCARLERAVETLVPRQQRAAA
jgi:glycosyltransferase involved in cell wall biosynthesis